MTNEFIEVFNKLDKVYADSEEKFVKNVILYNRGTGSDAYVYLTPACAEEDKPDKYTLLEICKRFEVLVQFAGEEDYSKVLSFKLHTPLDGEEATIICVMDYSGATGKLYSKEMTPV